MAGLVTLSGSRCFPLVLGVGLSLPPACPSRADDPGGAEGQDTTVIGWLKERAVPVRGLRTGAGPDDLRPLKKVLHGVRVVGVGEATHGTAEFTRLRHRLLEFLVREMGFTALAVEFSAADALVVNDYVLHGGTGREQVAACLRKSWISDTEEMNAVVDWLREHNGRSPPAGRVRFIGVDPQGNGRGIDCLRDYLRRAAPERLAKVEGLLDALRAEGDNASRFAPAKVTASQLADLYRLLSYLVLHRASLVHKAGDREWERALRHLRWLTQFAEFNASGSGGTRDGYMAENLLAAMGDAGPDTRCVLWAHNAHVCKRDTGAFPALGSYLRKAFGDGYYAFGVAFDRGSFVAQVPRVQPPRREVFTAGPAPAHTVDGFLARVGIEGFLVDLRDPGTDARVARWLDTPRNLHWVGVFFSKDGGSVRPFLLRRDFDGLAFVDQSTPPRPAAAEDGPPPRSTPPPAAEESAEARRVIDRAESALRAGKAASDVLTDPAYLPAHEWPRFRSLVRQFARSPDVTLVTAAEPGDALTGTGRVVDRDGRPARGVVLYAYHTSAKGWYSDRAPHVAAPEGDRKYARLFGYLTTDADGRFRIRTVRPGGYPDGDLPAHIHVELEPPGAGRATVVTEILFDDDPRLTPAARQRARQEGFVIAPVRRDEQRVQHVDVELRLR